VTPAPFLFATGIFGKFGYAHFFQNGNQGTELGKTGLKQVQPNEASEPEPVN
jgi:hypothetical protein